MSCCSIWNRLENSNNNKKKLGENKKKRPLIKIPEIAYFSAPTISLSYSPMKLFNKYTL